MGELEEKVRAGCLRRIRKDLNGVVQGIYGKKRFLVRFQDECENDLTSNQLKIMILERILVEEEPKVPMNTEISKELVTSDKLYYCGVYVIIYLRSR